MASKYTYIISTDKEPTKFIIYRAISPTNRIYVGQTTNSLQERIRGHFVKAQKYKGRIFARTLNKYKEQIKWEIIDYAIDWNELQELEKYWIKELNTYYYDNKKYGMNLTYGGDSSKGQKMSKKAKKNMSMKTTAYLTNPDNRIKISESHGGKPFNVYDENKIFIGQWQVQVDCAKELGIPRGIICKYLKGLTKIYKKYTFIYADEEQILDRIYEKEYKSLEFNVYKKDTLEYVGTWKKQRQAAIDLNLDYKQISPCLSGKRKQCNGYIFYFINKDPNINKIESDVICC